MRYQYLLVDNDNTLMDFDTAEHLALLDTLTAFSMPSTMPCGRPSKGERSPRRS